MGNYTSKTREEWTRSSLESIKHKFGDSKIKDSNNKEIEWDEIESYLGILYDHKYKNLDIKYFISRFNPKIDPVELDVYIS